MNIGIVTPQLCSYGGSEIYLLECLKHWQEHAALTVYTPSVDKNLLREFKIRASVNVVKLPSARTRDRRFRLLQEVVVMPRIWEQQIQRHDVYFLYLFPTHLIRRRPSVWFAAEPLRMLYDLRQYSNGEDAEIAVHFYPKHHYDRVPVSDLEILLQIIEKLDSEAAFDQLVTNSKTMGCYIENVYGRKPDHVVYPGIQLPKKISLPPSFDKVLYVGRLWSHKRVELIIKAMALTMSRNNLIIAGDGPEKGRLRQLVRSLGMTESVRFVGDVTMEERDRLYRECTCCVYTPIREPFGMVPLEAAAAGRPVVATTGGGYSEILTKDAAIFVPAYEGDIADGIHALMSEPDRAIEMGRAGRRIAEAYTWDRTAGALMDIFKQSSRRVIGGRHDRWKNPESLPKRLLGAHYYPWYQAGKKVTHWNENAEFAGVTDYPVGGPYSSTNRSLIKRHLQLVMQAGIDFLIVNLQVNFRGLNPNEVEATRKIFTVVEEEGHPMRLALLLAMWTEDPKVIRDTIRLVRKDFLSRPSYQLYEARPVLWYYLNDPLQGFLFYHYRKLKYLNRGIHPIATGSVAYNKFLPKLFRTFFSGWCFYSPFEVGPRRIWEIVWRETYRDFVEDNGTLRLFAICPGYDDAHLSAENSKAKRRRRIPRYGLKTYERMQRAALNLNPLPHDVIITSFNEFHENTHIEPSERFGDRYLVSTRAFANELHASHP